MKALRSVSCFMVIKYLGCSSQLMAMEKLGCFCCNIFLQRLFIILNVDAEHRIVYPGLDKEPHQAVRCNSSAGCGSCRLLDDSNIQKEI